MPLFQMIAVLVALVTLCCTPPLPAESPKTRCTAGERCGGPGEPIAATAGDPDASNAAPVSPVAVYPSDARWGDAAAPVTILYASDFECPFCSRVVPTLDRLKEIYGPSKLRIVFKHNPLPFHKNAEPTHLAAILAHRMGGNDAFWRFHHAVFESDAELNKESFTTWAVAAGLDAASFRAALDKPDPEGQQIIETHLSDNAQLGILGTPGFLINGRELSGAQPLEEFRKLIDEELAAAQVLQDSGVPTSHISAQRTLANLPTPGQPAAEEQAAAPEPAEEVETTVWAVPVSPRDPLRGVSDAPVTLVVFSDFECPFCKRVNTTLLTLLSEYGTDLRIIWKDNPLPFHKQARRAAALARFAYDTGGDALFWATHDLLFAYQAELGEETYERIATQLRLPWKTAKRAMDSNKYDAAFADSQDLAASFDAQGTPHFFINGRRLSGAQPIESFKALIDERLEAARALVTAGTPRDQVFTQIMEGAEGPAAPEQVPLPEPTAAHPRTGRPSAKVVVQAFTDYECPYCARAHETLDELLKKNAKDVQIVWRNMPLPFHKDAKLAAEAAQEVFVQRGNQAFAKFQTLLFENQKALSREDLEKYAATLGVNMPRFKKALDEHTHAALVEADMKIAEDAGIRGTPTFVINGYLLRGAQPYEAFRRILRYALEQQGAKL